MPTECNPALFDFARVESRAVVAAFDGGRITCTATNWTADADPTCGDASRRQR